VALDRGLTGNATPDGAVVMRAIRSGHLYTVVDGLASAPAFDFTASNELGTVHEGDELSAGSGVTLRIRSNAPPRYTTLVHEGAKVIASAKDPQDMTVHEGPQPAVYWVEVVSDGSQAPITWLRSNPIYVRGTEKLTQAATRPPPKQFVPLLSGALDGWRTEHDLTSVTAAEVINSTTGKEIQFRFGLSGGAPAGQVAALVVDTPKGVPDANRLAVTMRAERAMRVSVQLRGGAGGSERWERSLFVDRFDSEKTVYFDELTPVGNTQTWKPPLDTIRSVLFVVDTTNTKPGTSAKLLIKKAELQR